VKGYEPLSGNRLNKIKEFFIHDRFNYLLVVIGIGLRLRHFLENRSLWLDEAYVATRIIGRSWQEILNDTPMFPSQPKEPLIFSLIAKLFTFILGNHEYALRLLPFAASVLTLILFFRFMRKYIDPRAVPIALGLLVFCDPVVYYAAEVKPYSSDICVALLLFGLYKFISEREYSYGRYLLFGIVGSVSFWLSFPSLFVVAGLGTALLIRSWKDLDADKVKALLTIGLFGCISFGALYVRYFAAMTSSGYILGTWQDAFLPLSGTMLDKLLWVKGAWTKIFLDPLGLSCGITGAVLFFIGCVVVLRRDKDTACMLLLPLIFVFCAALLQKYPFKGRVLFFAIPALLMCLAEGLVGLLTWFKKYRFWLGLPLVTFLFYQPIKVSAQNFVQGREREENRAVMAFFDQHYAQGDMVYMNISAQFPFWYYSGKLGTIKRFPLQEAGTWNGRAVFTPEVGKIHDKLGQEQGKTYFVIDYVSDVYDADGIFRGFRPEQTDETFFIYSDTDHRFTGQTRVWIIFSHSGDNMKGRVLQYFSRRGALVQSYEKRGASVYLYRLHGVLMPAQG
jgi:hypothetical protein